VEGRRFALLRKAILSTLYCPRPIVHDLDLGDSEASVGLWMGQDIEGHFRNLTISKP
jgi:hypothetical protein